MTSDADGTGPAGLLLRLFLRRLIDNDIVSPNADRHEPLAALASVVVSLAVFITFFITSGYLADFTQLPGPTAFSALSDRFLFVAASITISGLAALMVWDGLAIEPRDAAILGPLPIPPGALVRAKLAAALTFGSAFAVALNAVPSVLYPLFLTMNLRGMTGRGVAVLIVVHAISVVLAGWFGFFTVLSIRGVARFVAGERGFRRVSSPIQSVLVVCAITALLLAPGVRRTAIHDWVAGTTTARWAARPALWYLAANETLAGQVVAQTPVVLPPRIWFTGRLEQEEREGRAAYLPLLPSFATLARRAWIATPLVALLSVITFLWNNRRLPEPAGAGRRPSRLGAGVHRLAERLAGDGETRAGFFFTWHTLTRSPPHRTVIAIAVAGGLTHLLIVLAASGLHQTRLASAPLGLLAIDNVALLALAAGFRYAVTVPPEFAAHWTIQMAWLGDARGYLRGAIRAALVIVAIVPLGLLLTLNIALFGGAAGVLHTIAGLAFAAITLEALFLGYRQLPFACSYVPIENPKLIWPSGFAAGAVLAYGFARLESRAAGSPAGTAMLAVALAVSWVAIRSVDAVSGHDAPPVNFDARPADATQRLGLFERVAD